MAHSGTSCPAGTRFYACDNNSFRGCCATDPCALLSCPDNVKDSKDNNNDDDEPANIGQELERPLKGTGRAGDDTESTTSTTKSKPGRDKTTTSDSKTTTMTDSGITHTIPNNSIVTVTKHTIIVTSQLPTSTTSSGSDSDLLTGTANTDGTWRTAQTPLSTNINTTGDSGAGSGGLVLSSGAIIGVAVGGATLLAILVIIIISMKRHSRKSHDSRSDLVFQDNDGRDDLAEEKHFHHPASAHTTGTQGSSDPFAPFGGRSDQPEDPYRPHGGAFEVDGTSAAPIELPAVSASYPSSVALRVPRLNPIQENASTDPHANLNSIRTDSGKPAHVNHWNQWKSIGGD